MHVLIIGGGTGELCLAHGLKRAGVSVAVYVRDRTRSDGLYGYRVGINATGNRALQQTLPPELFETFIATCARSPRYFNVLTEKLKFTAAIPLRDDHDPINSERSVSRMTLRQPLFTGMEDVVHFDKTFSHHQQRGDGRVTAFFADGPSATGDVLVAASDRRLRDRDGPHGFARVADSLAQTSSSGDDALHKPVVPDHAGRHPRLRSRGRLHHRIEKTVPQQPVHVPQVAKWLMEQVRRPCRELTDPRRHLRAQCRRQRFPEVCTFG
ncbi:MAG TPA: hypothetical protein VFR23_20805 [Jiangellaceae bacterium]|nr:hypothetical protein [Jiangellaceae bacterium]